MWLTGLLLVLAVCWAVPRPHGSAGLCTSLAWWPFLSGYVLALPAWRLCQAVSRGPGLGGVGFFVSLRLCGAVFNFLLAVCVGGLLLSSPGVRWPVAGVRQAGVASSHGCGRVSSPSRVCGGLLGLDPRLASLALVLWCALV